MTSDRHVRSFNFLGGVTVYSLRAEGRGAANRSHAGRPRPLSHAASHCSSLSHPKVAVFEGQSYGDGNRRSGLNHSRRPAPDFCIVATLTWPARVPVACCRFHLWMFARCSGSASSPPASTDEARHPFCLRLLVPGYRFLGESVPPRGLEFPCMS